MVIPPEGIKLNLGSGRWSLDGYVNVDLAVSKNAKRPPEILSDVRKIPLPDDCATEILAIHIFEHIERWEVDDVLEEWRRLMRKGGKLIMEMPDLIKCCDNIVKGIRGEQHPDQLGMWGLFGDPSEKDRLMMHAWSWTFATLRPLLKEHGFVDIRQCATQWHTIGRVLRDFRVEAIKS